jgi:hypothetical protein
MTVRKDLDELVGECDLAMTLAKASLNEDEIERTGRDASETGTSLLRYWLGGNDHSAEAMRQARTAKDLRDFGEKLLEIAELQRRRRMAMRLGGQVRRTSSNGSRVRFATGPSSYWRTADVH